MSLSLQQRAAAATTIVALNARKDAAIAWVTAQAAASTLPGGGIFGYGDAQGTLDALNLEVGNAISALGGPELDRVDSGEIAWDRWVNDANSLAAQIGSYSGDSGIVGAFDALRSLPGDVAKEAGDLADKLPTGAELGLGLGAGVLFLAFLAFVYVGGLRR